MKTYPYAETDVPPDVRRAFKDSAAWHSRVVLRPITPIELFAAGKDDRP
jgi:hypothetical protein